MKKSKELLLFLTCLVIPLVLFLVISGFAADVILDKPHFVGLDNYIRMFLSDKTFGKALLNTILPPVIVSFLLVSVFRAILFLVRKKIKVTRWVFYLCSVFIGGITALICFICVNVAIFGGSSDLYAAQTIVSQIIDYRPSVFDAISFSNVFLSSYIGVLTAFVFWILELIADIVKNFRRKREM